MPRLLVASLLVVSSCRGLAAPAAESEATFERARVGIVTRAGGRHAVEVELAVTEAQRARGLMFRRSLGEDEGMLFLFDRDEDQTFWMKNTFLPLDMIFIARDGTIAGILEQVPPQTETPRSVGRPSRYVLEVNGGWTALKGVKPGDRVELGEVPARLR